MRTVPTSGGIELGPEEGPWIDIVPLAPSLARGTELLQAADDMVAQGGEWREWRDRVGPLAGAAPELTGVTAAVPAAHEPRLLVMFRWWAREGPTVGLRRVEEHEGGLPRKLAAACLMAARAEGGPGSAPALVARSAPLLVDVDPSAPMPADRDALAMTCIEAAASGGPRPSVPTAAEAARLLLRVTRLLWREDVAARARRAWRREGRWQALADMAAAGAIAWGIERAAGPMGSMAVPPGAEGPAWSLYAEAVGTGLPRDGWRHLAEADDRAAHGPWDTPQGLDRDVCLAMAGALLAEARERARYALHGLVRLLPPREVGALGLRELRLFAEGRSIWAALHGPLGRLGPFRWAPLPDWPGSPVLPPEAMPMVHLVLAAAYRDLTVAGEAGMPRRTAAGRERAAAGAAAARTSEAARPLPTPVPMGRLAEGTRLWATPSERAAIRRAAALVRGHLRRLPDGWSATDGALAAAAEYGLTVPPGHTFVRPHARGGAVAAARPAVARGLVAIMALLPQQRATGRGHV